MSTATAPPPTASRPAPPPVPGRFRTSIDRLTDRRGWGARLGYLALILFLGYLVVLPLYRLQALAFEDGARGYDAQYSRPDIGSVIWTTVKLGGISLVIAMVLGTLLAFAVTRLPARFSWLRVIPVLPIVMPAIASVSGWAFLLSPGPGYLNAAFRTLPWWDHLESGPIDVYTPTWIILLTGFGLTSFVYLFVSAGMAGISAEHLEAAQTSGSSTVGVFFRVVLPLLRPSLVYGGGVALLLGLGQFTGPLLLGSNTGVKVLTTEMYRRVSESPADFAAAAAAGSPLVILGLVVVLGQKALLGNQSRFVTHGGKAFRSAPARSWWAVSTVVIYGFVALVAPLLGLIAVALSPYWSESIQWNALTLDNFRQLLSTPDVIDSVVTSLVASSLAVAICVPLGFAMANLLVRGRRYTVLRLAGDLITALPLGIPAVIFGVGFLLTYTQPPFILYGTRTVIVLVYVVLMLPFATRLQMTALLSLGETYAEASATSGASSLVTNLRIILPLMRPAILSAVALMFILLTHEFAASLLVRAPTTQVMGTRLYDLWANGFYPQVAAMALLMTVVTGLGVGVAMLIGGKNVLDNL
ncbi:iron(III) transport system permease protein [Nocardioides zeae]|uniref:Iron(III) transport system permease protein n=2 Tax=Nocardioides zeae TaxID=1457234 RepID=A0AAJ1U142_9ACTN|nr:iron ABC transporter permease [Nocardioides zeae]MDQ1105650.1 iron(III) transport system permease protein [Nocardioides zeae]MDR6174700.1 iron(III) transport system permease protein [Nocardioides zeae]MDR6210769.1 iron(III) transport system permease protein [Nocardioides zeae]